MKNRTKVFVDSSAFIALRGQKDPHHQNALKISSGISKDRHILYTSFLVIFEVLEILKRAKGKEAAAKFYKEVTSTTEIKIVSPSKKMYLSAYKYLQKQKSRKVGSFDCIHFATMDEFNIKSVFGFDKDFERNGFRLFEA